MSRSCGGSAVTSRSPISTRPAGRRLQPGDHAERGALAAPRRPHQHHELAVGDLDVEPPGGDVAVGIGLLDALEPHRCHGYPFTAPAVRPWTIRRWNSEHQQRHRRRGHDRRGQDLPPGHLVLAAEQRDRHRHRLPLGAEREREREEELVPAVHEGEDRGGGEPGTARAAGSPRASARSRLAPSTMAASSSSAGSWRKNPTSSQTVSGMAKVRYGRISPG